MYVFMQHYGTTFPIISMEDVTNMQFLLLDHLKVEKVKWLI